MPTHPVGAEGQQDPVRLKNLLDDAERQMSDGPLRGVAARDLVQPVRELPDDAEYWRCRSDGLAIFLAPGFCRHYRLPERFAEQVRVAQRFLVRPLLPVIGTGERCWILALSQNKVRLFDAAERGIHDVELPALATGMAEALDFTTTDRGSQTHSAMRGGVGKQAAVFHGQGGQPDRHKDDVAHFFRQVDASLKPIFRDQSRVLVLAGVEYLLPIYRHVSGYAHLAERELLGNFDYLTPHEIHARARPLLEHVLAATRADAAKRVALAIGTAAGSDDVKQIIPAASQGRVDTLLVHREAEAWGRIDPITSEVDVHARRETGDEDLLDRAVAETLAHRGAAYSLAASEMPSERPAAALFRY